MIALRTRGRENRNPAMQLFDLAHDDLSFRPAAVCGRSGAESPVPAATEDREAPSPPMVKAAEALHAGPGAPQSAEAAVIQPDLRWLGRLICFGTALSTASILLWAVL